MMNIKQKELIDEVFYKIKERFSEVKLINITHSPEDPADLWVNITAPEDEDREMELREFASEWTTDVLMDYGYGIYVMPA